MLKNCDGSLLCCLGVNAAEFIEASKDGNLVPLSRCIFGDQLDPVLAYRCLVKENDWDAPSFLFESVESNAQVPFFFNYNAFQLIPFCIFYNFHSFSYHFSF